MQVQNKLDQNFKFWSLARFALPTMAMMMVTSLYSVVDAMFVSRFVSTNALSSVNIVFPVINIVLGFGIMLATGGSAVIARKMGQGKGPEAKANFSFLVLVGALSGVVLAVVGIACRRPIVRLLGASDPLFENSVTYLAYCLGFAPAWIVQQIFASFFVTAGRPNFGMAVSIAAGLVNALLDYVLIVPCGLGVAGAAIATGVGQCVPIVAGLFVFCGKRGTLVFARPKGSWKLLGKSCFNGSSEMVSNLSMGLTTFLFNFQMLKFAGEDGVAAVTIVMCAQYLFTSALMGFTMGVAPVISFNYGKGDRQRLHAVVRNSLIFVGIVSVVMCAAMPLLSPYLIALFTDSGPVTALAREGILPYALSFLLCGVNIFASGMYTAFSNGKVSAVLSFLRTCVFLSAGILLLPLWLQITGVWLAVPAAELCALVLSVLYLRRGRRRYGY